jgi:hypothetical protein
MNKKAQMERPLLIIIAIVLILVALAFIEPLKGVLDDVLGVNGFNCSNPSNPTLSYKLPCWFLQGGVFIVVGGILYYIYKWVVNNFKK